MNTTPANSFLTTFTGDIPLTADHTYVQRTHRTYTIRYGGWKLLMLFKRMPDVKLTTTLTQSPTPQFFIVKNIWRRNEVLDKYLTSLTLFDTCTPSKMERPQRRSVTTTTAMYFLVGLSSLSMISLTTTETGLMDAGTLKEYVYNKYPNPDATSHYETTKVVDALDRTIIEAGKQVPSNFSITYFDGTASAGVTVNPVKTVEHYEKETRENDARREIKLIRPAHIRDFVDVTPVP